MNAPLWVAVPAVVIAVLAIQTDVKSRIIPNLLTFPALAAGIAVHAWMGGLHGAWTALAGAGVAGGLLIPGWIARYQGGGDVKLMAALGAWLGFPLGMYALLAALVAGGVLALVVAARQRILKQSLQRAARLAAGALPDVAPSGTDETSLVMSAPNRPGAVHALLEPFARHGVSMTRFESRPARTGLWEYLFFVDVLGHRLDPPVATALAELAQKAPFLKLLGSYPAALT